MGARTGRASVVTALCFVPCFFLGPLAAAVPGYATAAVLSWSGVSMFQSVTTIDFTSLEDALPAFVTVVLIPLTLSITQGILWGFLLHALLYAVAGRARESDADLVDPLRTVGRAAGAFGIRRRCFRLPFASSRTSALTWRCRPLRRAASIVPLSSLERGPRRMRMTRSFVAFSPCSSSPPPR